MAKLVCEKCNEEKSVPMHCGQEMHQEGDQLVCWMGTGCGHQPMEQHCGQPMIFKEQSKLKIGGIKFGDIGRDNEEEKWKSVL